MDNMYVMEDFSTMDLIFTLIAILLILTWLVVMTWYITLLLKRFTFADWSKKENPYKDETLGLPCGTLRGVLTLTLLIVVVILVITSLIVTPLRGEFDSLMDAFQVMLAFYFGSKIMEHMTNSDKKKTQEKYKTEMYVAKMEAMKDTQPELMDPFNQTDAVG